MNANIHFVILKREIDLSLIKQTNNSNSNSKTIVIASSNSIYFKSLKCQWFSGLYMSIRRHTLIQTFKHTQYEKMKKTYL